MRIYEQLFIVDPKATDEQIDAVVAQVEEVVKEAGGSMEKVDKWGVRRLAYRVRKQKEGHYVLVVFNAGGNAVKEIERRMRVDEVVLKFISVRVDEKRKWLEKRRKIREKRAARRPERPSGPPSHAQRGPARPAAGAVPGKPTEDAPAAPAE